MDNEFEQHRDGDQSDHGLQGIHPTSNPPKSPPHGPPISNPVSPTHVHGTPIGPSSGLGDTLAHQLHLFSADELSALYEDVSTNQQPCSSESHEQESSPIANGLAATSPKANGKTSVPLRPIEERAEGQQMQPQGPQGLTNVAESENGLIACWDEISNALFSDDGHGDGNFPSCGQQQQQRQQQQQEQPPSTEASSDPGPGPNPDPNPGPDPNPNPDPNPGPDPGPDPNPGHIAPPTKQAQVEAQGSKASRYPKRTRRPTRIFVEQQLENQGHKRRRN